MFFGQTRGTLLCVGVCPDTKLKWVFYVVMAFPFLSALLLCGQGPLTSSFPNGSLASALNQPCAQWCGLMCPEHSWQKAGIIAVLMQVADGEDLGVWGTCYMVP